MRQVFVVGGLLFALTGCATVFDHSTELIEIRTPGVDQAQCFLDNSLNRYRVITPGKVRVERSTHDLTLTCSKEGHTTDVSTLKSVINDTAWWNIFNGILPGASYDVATGALYEYPDYVEIFLVPEVLADTGPEDDGGGAAATERYRKVEPPVSEEEAPADKVFDQNATKPGK